MCTERADKCYCQFACSCTCFSWTVTQHSWSVGWLCSIRAKLMYKRYLTCIMEWNSEDWLFTSPLRPPKVNIILRFLWMKGLATQYGNCGQQQQIFDRTVCDQVCYLNINDRGWLLKVQSLKDITIYIIHSKVLWHMGICLPLINAVLYIHHDLLCGVWLYCTCVVIYTWSAVVCQFWSWFDHGGLGDCGYDMKCAVVWMIVYDTQMWSKQKQRKMSNVEYCELIICTTMDCLQHYATKQSVEWYTA